MFGPAGCAHAVFQAGVRLLHAAGPSAAAQDFTCPTLQEDWDYSKLPELPERVRMYHEEPEGGTPPCLHTCWLCSLGQP